MIADIKKSVIAGILISFGGCVYLACVSKGGMDWVGALLFSTGLFTICEYGYHLYTGRVGYVGFRFRDFTYMKLVLMILVVNLLTTFIIGIAVGAYFDALRFEAAKIYSAKLAARLPKSFISSLFCGVLMYLAVETWKRGKVLGVFLFVPLFIMSGFDHSIANSFYCGATFDPHFMFSLRNVAFVTVVVIGNGIGGILVPMLTRSWVR